MKDLFATIIEMQEKYDDLLKAHLELSNTNTNLNTKCIELEALVKYYEELLRLNRAKKFGPSSEKGPFADQISLFNEVEAFSDSEIVQVEDEEYQTTVIRRKKRRGKRDYSRRTF